MPAEYDDDRHEQHVGQSDGHEVFPLKVQDLVHPQTREGPLHPHQQEDHEEGFAEEPHEARDPVHRGVEPVESRDVQRHPAAQKERGGHAGHDEQVDEFGDVEQAEVHARVLGVIPRRELRLGLREVERASVGLGVAGDQIDHEGDAGRDMPLEDEPAVGLLGDDFRKLHRIGQHDDREDRQSDREFVADHLCAAAHGADERILVVAAPACEQHAHHADRRGGHQEEDAHMEIEDLHALVDR